MPLSKLRIKVLIGFVCSALVAAPLLLVAGTASADSTTWSAAQSTSIDLSAYNDFGYDGYLNSVSCITGTTCVAAGVSNHYEPMQLTGDAQTWGVGGNGETTGDDSNLDNAVSDPTGGSDLSYLDLSNNSISNAQINSISCSTTTSCVAVGASGDDEPFVITGDPAEWTSGNSFEITTGLEADNGEFESVSCLADGWCLAVGSDSDGGVFEISGDPSSWATTGSLTDFPFGDFHAFGHLNGVSCVSETQCVAVGNVDSYTEQNDVYTYTYDYLSFNGDPTTWTVQDALLAPTPENQYSALNGVSCVTSDFYCVAVGSGVPDGNVEPVFLSGSPNTWEPASSDYPGVESYSLGDSFGDSGIFDGVSCVTTSYCVAVGYDNYDSDNDAPLVVTGDPSQWASDTTNADATEIDPEALPGYLGSVSCTGVGTCVAVGHFGNEDDPGPFTAWIAANTAPTTAPIPVLYPVTYVANGASGTPPTQASLNPGATFTVASPSSLSYPGYTFTGWSDGTTTYQPGSTYTMPKAPVTLTAQWVTTSPASPASTSPPSKQLLRTEVLFPFNKYYLTAQAKKQLISFAKEIAKSDATSFTVVGSTDLFGSEGYNIPLSEHRAHAVSAYLTAQLALLGITNVVFHDTWIGILKTQPTYTQNRRTVVAD